MAVRERFGVAIAAVVTLVMLGLPGAAPDAAELAEREAVSDLTRTLFMQRNFAALNDLAEEYRTTKRRTSSGLWYLTLFYAEFKEQFLIDLQMSRDDGFVEHKRAARAWATEFPDSPTGHMVYALALAFEARLDQTERYYLLVPGPDGTPPPKTVTHARTYLEQHEWIAAVDPQWYEVMATVALVEQWDFFDFLALIDEALDREPLFYETHFRAVDYFTSLTTGGAAEIEALAMAAVDRTTETEGQGMYARIYWWASQSVYGNGLFSRSNVDWPKMRAGFVDVLEHYPDAWNLNNFAKFACLAEDVGIAGQLAEHVKEDLVPQAWNPGSLYAQCEFWLRLAQAR